MKMIVNGLQAEFNMPMAPKGDGTHGLPPYNRQKVFVVDEYPACPTNWEHGSSKASSYFAALRPGAHMWFDFNMNANYSHHIAIVCSIQGINPVTGQRTKVLRLEQYKDKCPTHDIKFKQDRFCEKCGYKWPAQNYLTTANMPLGHFWIDGFRAEDGTVRGFLISEEQIEGIAAQMIGEDRVWAVGIAYYLSKEPWARPVPTSFLRSQSIGLSDSLTKGGSAEIYTADSIMDMDTSFSYGASGSSGSKGLSGPGGSSAGGGGTISSSGFSAAPRKMRSTSKRATYSSSDIKQVDTKKLEIAAGAKISQELNYPDPNDLDFYQDEPIGINYMNFTDLESVKKILKAGKRDLTQGGEGFLAPLKTGNK